MKKIIILLVLLLLTACGQHVPQDNTSNKVFSNAVFSKEDIDKKINEGLSDVWEDYMINVVNYYRDDLPDNVKESLINGVGEYKYDKYQKSFNNWDDYFYAPDEVGTVIHALLDLYKVTPDMFINSVSKDALNEKVSNNPKIDLSQYVGYEDGDAFIPYFSSMGSEVLAQNDYVKVEGPKDITVDYYESIGRTARITNISNEPVYIFYNFIEMPNQGNPTKAYDNFKSMPEYEQEYDRIEDFINDTTNTFMPFIPKDILMPGEVTYLRVDFTGFKNFNSHWYFETYQIDENEFNKALENDKLEDFKSNVRINSKSEDIALILKNRTLKEDDYDIKYATIKGTIYNEDGEPLAFMPFRVIGLDENGHNDTRSLFTSYDGSFCVKAPVALYKTDNTYARYAIFVDGERMPIDGQMVTVLINDDFELNGVRQEGVKYSDFIKGKTLYGQKSLFIQPTEEKEYEVAVVVPNKLDHIVYDYGNEEDYGGQANYYDYNNGVFATVKFHDEEPGANKTAYLNVFDTDGNLIFRKHLGIQTACVEVSPDASLIGTTITNEAVNIDYDFENPPANIGNATIFDINGNEIFRLNNGTRAMAISHDNKYVALDVNGQECLGIMDINTKEVLWKDYRGAQIRYLIFSEDDSVLYMASQESIVAYNAKTGEKLWQTFTLGAFPIDMIMSSKYLYASPKSSGGNDNKLLCIDRKTGETVWSYQTGSRGTKLTISPDETILFWGNDTGARDAGLYMLDANTGEPLWTLNYGGQAAWFTSDSKYVAIKDYGILEVFTRDGRKVATTACGSNSKMSWFVYIKDDLSKMLNIAGGGNQGNSGWLYNLELNSEYNRDFIDKQLGE